MKTRPLKELLPLVRDTLAITDNTTRYICNRLIQLRLDKEINIIEHHLLEKFINDNKPSIHKHSHLTKHPYYTGMLVWWNNIGEIGTTARKEFIQHLIDTEFSVQHGTNCDDLDTACTDCYYNYLIYKED